MEYKFERIDFTKELEELEKIKILMKYLDKVEKEAACLNSRYSPLILKTQ